MKVYASNDFLGFSIGGTAAVVVAADEAEARKFLIRVHPLADEYHFEIQEIDTTVPGAWVLCDGDL